MVAPVCVPFSGTTFHHVGAPVLYKVPICAHMSVKRSECISLALGFLSAPYGGGLEIP